MNSIDLQVEGMSCGSCVKHVSEALRPLPGVSEVHVDLQVGRVRVSGEADSAQLIAALQEAGYPAQLAKSEATPMVPKTGGCGGHGQSGGCCCH